MQATTDHIITCSVIVLSARVIERDRYVLVIVEGLYSSDIWGSLHVTASRIVDSPVDPLARAARSLASGATVDCDVRLTSRPGPSGRPQLYFDLVAIK